MAMSSQEEPGNEYHLVELGTSLVCAKECQKVSQGRFLLASFSFFLGSFLPVKRQSIYSMEFWELWHCNQPLSVRKVLHSK